MITKNDSNSIREVNDINDMKNTNKKEESIKRKSSRVIKEEILMKFNDEDEKKDINIVYNEPGNNKSIKYISLDLLLKKIVIDDFLEKNMLLIYYFCQQCFCFIDTKILFNKIINCYHYYRSKGVPPLYLSNLITFFNILVIEMYQYYNQNIEDETSLSLINNFYEIVENEIENINENLEIIKENTNNLRVSFKGNNYENLPEVDENDKKIKIYSTKNLNKKIILNSPNMNSSNLPVKENEKTNENQGKEQNYYYNNYYSINDNNNINNNININELNNENNNDNNNDNHNHNDNHNNDNHNENNNNANYNNNHNDNHNQNNEIRNNQNNNDIITTNQNNNDIITTNQNTSDIITTNQNNNNDITIDNNKEDENIKEININEEIKINSIKNKNDDKTEILEKNKEFNSETKSRNSVLDPIIPINKGLEIMDKDHLLLWNKTENKNKENKTENRNIKKSLKKKNHFFLNIFKQKIDPKKNKSCDIRNSIKERRDSGKKKKYKAKDEKILDIIKDIKMFLSNPNSSKIFADIKNSILFYKNVSNNNTIIINKIDLENKKVRKLNKCPTEDNIFKKKKKTSETKNFFNVLEWEEKDIGNKLFRISESLINKIQSKELYKAAFLKKNKYTISPNVMENIDHFNRLSFFIILDILSYDSSKDRAKMIEKWGKIADYCKKKNDFNDLLAINSALNNYIITGLKITFKDVSKKSYSLLKELNKFCDCQGNFKTMRNHIVHLKQEDYYIPYLGMLLRDLAFNEESSKYIINGVLINLEKIEKVQKIIDKFFRFKTLAKKEIDKIPTQLKFFENLENIKEEKLERIANNIEPNFNYCQKKFKRPTYIDTKYFSYLNI